MRDLGWFVLSGLVVVFWLSFGPRVAAAELTFHQNDDVGLAGAPIRPAMRSQGILSFLGLFSQPEPEPLQPPLRRQLLTGGPPIASLTHDALTQFQPSNASARLAKRLISPSGRLVRCGDNFLYCLVAR